MGLAHARNIESHERELPELLTEGFADRLELESGHLRPCSADTTRYPIRSRPCLARTPEQRMHRGPQP